MKKITHFVLFILLMVFTCSCAIFFNEKSIELNQENMSEVIDYQKQNQTAIENTQEQQNTLAANKESSISMIETNKYDINSIDTNKDEMTETNKNDINKYISKKDDINVESKKDDIIEPVEKKVQLVNIKKKSKNQTSPSVNNCDGELITQCWHSLDTIVVISDNLNIRKKYGTHGKVIGTVKRCESLTVIDKYVEKVKSKGISRGWLKIRTQSGIEGWVAGWYTRCVKYSQ